MSDILKFSKFKVGEPRFPKSEEPANGPVIEYRLSPEEIEKIRKKYGPPAKRSRQNQPINFKSKAQREAAKMKVIDKARESLPKDKLGALLAQGLTGSQISKDYDIPYWALVQLKEEYWGGSFNPDDYLAEPEEKQEGQQASDDHIKSTQKLDAGEIDLNGFDWAVPARIGIPEHRKIISISEKRVSLSAGAIKALLPCDYIQIGIKNKIIAVIRARDEKYRYKLPQQPKAAQIGGKRLITFLMDKHGLEPGEYELEEYKEGCLVSKR